MHFTQVWRFYIIYNGLAIPVLAIMVFPGLLWLGSFGESFTATLKVERAYDVLQNSHRTAFPSPGFSQFSLGRRGLNQLDNPILRSLIVPQHSPDYRDCFTTSFISKTHRIRSRKRPWRSIHWRCGYGRRIGIYFLGLLVAVLGSVRSEPPSKRNLFPSSQWCPGQCDMYRLISIALH